MKRIVIRIVWALVALAVIFMGGAYVLPGEATVARSVAIAAPVEKVWPVVSDLRRFNEFSPWADLDPAAEYTYSGPENSIGQTLSWTTRNGMVGTGSQTITAIDEGKRVETAIDFGEMGKARAVFDLIAAGQATNVTWTFRAALNNPLERWLGFLLYDRWIGADCEKGLARLKAIAEKS